MTAMRHELQNDILVELMYCIKIKKEKINENVLYRVEENSGWQGTPVPNTGYVENVYFNTELSVDEVVSLLSKLDLNYGGVSCRVISTVDDSKNILIAKQDELYAIMFAEGENGNYLFVSADVGIGFVGWNTSINYPIAFNSEVRNSFEDDGETFEIGYQNNQLSSLFSVTPFEYIESKPQLYHFKDRVPYKVGLTKEDVIDIINEQFENAEEGAY